MKQHEMETLLGNLQALPKECEWAEFKVNNSNPQEIGEYLSALSNSACYSQTTLRLPDLALKTAPTNWLAQFQPVDREKGKSGTGKIGWPQLNPRIDFNIFDFEHNGLHFAIFRVDATRNMPVSFRVCPTSASVPIKTLDEHPEREKKNLEP